MKRILLVFVFLLVSTNWAKAQMTQFCIGSPGNEMATKICYLPSDSSSIIAGYTYDIVAGAATNCHGIIMKVTKAGVIAWQKSFGITGKNNFVQDMIITQDNNIVVVGTVGGNGNMYADNTAAILKYNSTNGNLMWQNCFRDAATTTGGELFFGVTELRDGTGRLVAIGAHNFTGAGAGSMICVFQGTGALIYNEVFDAASGDAYQAITTSAAGNSVYIVGEFVGDFKDGMVVSYTPGATAGTINWSQYFDFYLYGSLQDNFISKVFLSGTKLVIAGGCLHNYSTTSGEGNYVATLNAADGSGLDIRGIQNSGAAYGNNFGMAVLSPDHLFFVQSPSSTYYDATLWTPGATTNSVVTEITSFTGSTANAPVKFVSSAVGQHSILDMQYGAGALFMAGATNVSLGFGNNDIYFVNAGTDLASSNHTCDTVHDIVSITTPTYTVPSITFTNFSFAPAYNTVDTGTTHLNILSICGDIILGDTICNTLTMPDSLVACSGVPIALPATLSGPDSVLSYTWTPATGLSSSTVLNPTLTGAVAGWYHLTVQSILPTNFVTNGDFAAGNTGFTSSYTVEAPAPVSTPGNYAVTTNPSLYDATFPAFGDHTSGTGNMLLVDGSPSAGLSFWCETIPVTANTDYVFSAWTALAHLPLPSIQLSINGSPVGTFAPSVTAGAWVQYRVAWNSGPATTANICLSDLVNTAFGNDFAIDDIAFQKLCTLKDSIYVSVDFSDTTSTSTDSIICFSTGNTAPITAPSGYTSYLWNVGNTTQTISVASGVYWVYCRTNCSTLVDTFHVTLLNDTMRLLNPDTAICRFKSVQVRLGGNPALSYQWLPTAGIPISTLQSPLITPDTSALYTVTASMTGCPDLVASFFIDVQPVPTVFIGGNREVCRFDTLHLHATVTPNWYTHYIYSWTPATFLDDSTMSTVIFRAGDSTKLILTVTTPAGCTSKDSALMIVHTPVDSPNYNFDLCPGDSVQLVPPGGVSYHWSPGIYLSDSTAAQPWVHPITSQYYTVVATDQFGCHPKGSANVVVRPNGVIYLTDSVSLFPGESYHIEPVTNCTQFLWYPPAGLDYYKISDPVATPLVNTKYIVTAWTEWGCKTEDSISIRLDETVLAIPNAFTPGAGVNNFLYLIKRGTATLNYLRIWNRWGNMVFETSNVDEGWDGKYKGVPQPFGVYVYQLEAVTNSGHRFTKHGNVTLLR